MPDSHCAYCGGSGHTSPHCPWRTSKAGQRLSPYPGTPARVAIVTTSKQALAQPYTSPAKGLSFWRALMAFKSKPTVTRPANVTAYTAGDVVGGAITFEGIAPYGGDIYITSTTLRANITAIPAGMTSFRLYLYDATPASAIADNAAWLLHTNDLSSYLGYIDMGSPALPAATSAAVIVHVDQNFKQFRARTATLYGYLVTNGGFTPAANSEVYVPELNAVALPN
jgi:hypothetical protein